MNKQTKILEAALKLFVEFGFHATPTSKIAKEAGVANGTLFHYYKTKDELILALYIDVKSRLSEYIYNHINKDTDFKFLLKGIYINTIEWAANHKSEFYFMQQFNTSPYLSLVSIEEIHKQVKPHLDLLEAGIKNKDLKNIPTELLLRLINNHIYAVNQYLNSEDLSVQKTNRIVNETFEMLWLMLS